MLSLLCPVAQPGMQLQVWAGAGEHCLGSSPTWKLQPHSPQGKIGTRLPPTAAPGAERRQHKGKHTDHDRLSLLLPLSSHSFSSCYGEAAEWQQGSTLAEPDSLLYFGFFFFWLSFQLPCRMPNPPWTSGEVPGHRATCQVGSTLHSSAEFLLVPAVTAQRVSKTQNPGQERKTIVSGPARPQRARWKPPGLSIRAQEGQALQQSISDTRGSELPEFPEPGRDPGRASPSLPRHQQQPSLFSLFKSHSTNTFFTCSYHNKVPKSVEKQSKSSSAREKRREQNRGKEGYIKYSQGSGK